MVARFGNSVDSIIPVLTKTSQETKRACKSSWSDDESKSPFILTNSLEIGKSFEELTWNCCTSTPHRSETLGIAERAVRRSKEGTSAILLQSGLGEKWWADVPWLCYCYLRNVQDRMQRRF